MVEQTVLNPLLEKRKRSMPGVTFRLPSRGEIYQKGVLSEDVVDGEVVVYPMRLREELKMKSIDSIFQGSAVSDTISYCVPQVLDPENLCPTDIDFLMTAIKKLTHGDIFQYKDVCMKIEDMVDRSSLISENVETEYEESNRVDMQDGGNTLEEISKKLKSLDEEIENSQNDEETYDPVEKNKNNLGVISKFCQFEIPLSHFLDTSKELDPEVYEDKKRINFNGFDIEMKQISFKDFKEISNLRLQDNPTVMTDEQYSEYINSFSNVNIARRIRVVDNISDQHLIEEWVDSFSLQERTELLTKISEAYDWGINFEYTINCATCGKTKTIDMSYINPLYFFLTS